MPFVRVMPQQVVHSDGYVVASKDRYHMQYWDNAVRVVIGVDRGIDNIGVYKNSMKFYASSDVEMTAQVYCSENQHEEIFSRIINGLIALGYSRSHIEFL